jgi:O-antigen/teichoic acid export membrane protein
MASSRGLDMILTVFARVGGKSLNLLVFAIVARNLSLGELGVYGFIFSITLILSTVLDLGVRNSLAVMIGKDAESTDRYASQTFMLWCILALLTAPALYLAYFGSQFDLETPAFLIPSTILLASMLYLRMMQGVLLGTGEIAMYNRSELASRIILVALTAIFLVLGNLSLMSAIWSLAVSQAVAALYLLVSQWRTIRSGMRWDLGLAMALVSRGVVFMLSVLLMNASKRLAVLVISQLSSAENAGLFFALQRLTDVITEVGLAVAVVIFSHNVRAKSSGDAVQATAHSTRISFFVFTLMAIGLALTAHWTVPLALGTKFAGHTDVFVIVLAGTLIASVWTLLFPSLSVVTSPLTVFLLFIPGLSLNVAIIYPLMNWFGLAGAAWSMLIANIVLTASFLAVYKIRFGVSPRDFLIPTPTDFAAVSKLAKKFKK